MFFALLQRVNTHCRIDNDNPLIMERVYVYRQLWALCKCEAAVFNNVDIWHVPSKFLHKYDKISILSGPVMSWLMNLIIQFLVD